jgi:carbohydrate-selective porin OprB
VLTVKQELMHDRLEFELGYTNPSYDFDPVICGDGPNCAGFIAKYVAGMTPIDNGQLGAIARVTLPDAFFAKAGLFDIRPAPSLKTGISLLLANNTGAEVDLQLGRTTTFKTAYLPGSYTITGLDNTAKVTNGLTKYKEYGALAVLGTGLQTIWREGSAGPALPMHHLDLFYKVGYTPDVNEFFNDEVTVGANYYGLFPDRPFDRLGIKFTYLHLTHSGLATEEAAIVKAKGPKSAFETPPNEYTVQVLATADLYRHATVTPAFMYIINPDDFSGNTKRLPHEGWQFTVTFRVPLGTILGLAK